MKIEHWSLTKFMSYARELRTHDDVSVDEVAAAIARFGFRVPVLAKADGTVIDGALRLRAAERLRLATVPVIVADDLSDEEVRAFRISINRLSELAEWNIDLLALELQELIDIEIDTEGLGFDDKALNDLLRSLDDDEPDPPAEISRADELAEKWGTELGQLWTIGAHRLLIGDATAGESWARLMGERRAACVFTDPPYGVSYVAASGKHKKIANDDLSGDKLLHFLLKTFVQLAENATPSAAWYVWHAGCTRDEFILALKAAGIREVQTIIWVKPGHVLGRSHYHWAHEPCIYGCRAGETPTWYGDRKQSTAWRVGAASPEAFSVAIGPGLIVRDGRGNSLFLSEEEPADKRIRALRLDEGQPINVCRLGNRGDTWEVSRDAAPDHPTQKPAELARRALENSTAPGDVVLDAFLGSGSTMLGAERCGRACYGTELSPAYAGVILERMSLMGLKPEYE